MFFWIAIVGILLLTLVAIWRSWASQLHADITAEQSDVAIYNARVEEIERDLVAKRLDPEMAEAAKAEEARKLLKSQTSVDTQQSASEQPSGWWMTLGLFSIPLVSVLIYLSIGTPPGSQTSEEAPEVAQQSMDQLIAAAERRLETNPDDLQGWQVLAPVYLRQQEFTKAENAFRNIIRINGESTEVLSTLGEVQVAKASGQVTSAALQSFERAIALDAKNSNARFFIGLYAFQTNDRDGAKAAWQTMIEGAKGDEDWLPAIKRRVAQLEETDTDGPTPDSVEEITNLPQEEQQARIQSMVAGLAARLEENPTDKAGWLRLVRAYMVLGQPEEADDALTNAKQAFPGDQEFAEQLQNAKQMPQGASN